MLLYGPHASSIVSALTSKSRTHNCTNRIESDDKLDPCLIVIIQSSDQSGAVVFAIKRRQYSQEECAAQLHAPYQAHGSSREGHCQRFDYLNFLNFVKQAFCISVWRASSSTRTLRATKLPLL
jgi:hypothetical protein